MPTGYTYKVQDGKITSLKDFAFECARGMGACITMRDDPSGTPIPESFKPSTEYYDEQISTNEALIDTLSKASTEEINRLAKADYEAESIRLHERVANVKLHRERYEAMHKKVSAWENSPEGLKKFMLSQLSDSIEFDCSDPMRYTALPLLLSAREYREKKIKEAMTSLRHCQEERLKEIERTQARNVWLKQLRESLEGTD